MAPTTRTNTLRCKRERPPKSGLVRIYRNVWDRVLLHNRRHPAHPHPPRQPGRGHIQPVPGLIRASAPVSPKPQWKLLIQLSDTLVMISAHASIWNTAGTSHEICTIMQTHSRIAPPSVPGVPETALDTPSQQTISQTQSSTASCDPLLGNPHLLCSKSQSKTCKHAQTHTFALRIKNQIVWVVLTTTSDVGMKFKA